MGRYSAIVSFSLFLYFFFGVLRIFDSDIAGVPHGEEIFISVYINYTFSWEMLGESKWNSVHCTCFILERFFAIRFCVVHRANARALVRIPLDQYREVNRRFALEHWYPFGTGGGWRRDDIKESNPGEIGLIIGVFEVSVFVWTKRWLQQTNSQSIIYLLGRRQKIEETTRLLGRWPLFLG